MKAIIQEKLHRIATEFKVKIPYACESGSRAWGFPSPDSDYDVRFIYVKDLDWHLTLKEQKDTIDLPINDDLDLGGWEIKKVLKLLWKSNAPLLEWLQSPIVYHSEGIFLSQLRQLSHAYFSPIATMHHYLSMSKKYADACSGEQIKLKKLFYAMRTAIAGVWIRETGTVPPIEMKKMFSVLDASVVNRINELIAIKEIQQEDYLHPKVEVIADFLRSAIAENERVANDLPGAKGDFEALDVFYKQVIKEEL